MHPVPSKTLVLNASSFFLARFHGKDEEGNLVYFKLSKMKDLFDAHDDGHYYLPIKSVKVRQVFRIA